MIGRLASTVALLVPVAVAVSMSAEAAPADLLAAKLAMQFGTPFDLREADGTLYAFQAGIPDQKQAFYVERTGWFSAYFQELMEHDDNVTSGLRIVFLESRDAYRESFGVPGMVAHYNRAGKTIHTYQMSGAHTLYHELGHHFIRVILGDDVPLWFNEGLASYFERSIDGRFGCTNWRLPFLKQALGNGRYIPLPALLAGTWSADQYFLAEARHLFVYLAQLGVFERFLIGVKEHGPGASEWLLVELTGMSIEELDAGFRNEIKGWRKNTYVAAPS